MNGLTEQVIGCAYQVANTLGCGFLEKVYENALVHELRKSGVDVSQQCPIKVFYDEVVVGEYVADLLISDSLLVELKSVKVLDSVHMAQCMNYLKATKSELGLLINFGKSVEVKRKFVRNSD